jgi:hypothetical protein
VQRLEGVLALTPEELAEVTEAARLHKFIKTYSIMGRKYTFTLPTADDEEAWNIARATEIAKMIVIAGSAADNPAFKQALDEAINIFDQRKSVESQLIAVDDKSMNREETVAFVKSLNTIELDVLSATARHKHRARFYNLVTRSIGEENIKK